MTLDDITLQYSEATNLFNNGELSKEEYLNILQGLEVEKAVVETAEDLDKKTQLNTMIVAAINIASMV